MSPNFTTKVLHAIVKVRFIKSTQSKIIFFPIKNKLNNINNINYNTEVY